MRLPLVFPLLILVACGSEQGLGKYDPAAGAGGPDIEVSPGHLNFGSLNPDETATKSFDITNVGEESSVLNVSKIEIKGSGSFTILTEDTKLEIPYGATETIDVVFTPLEATAEGQAIIHSDDEDEAEVSVDLTGEGAVPELQGGGVGVDQPRAGIAAGVGAVVGQHHRGELEQFLGQVGGIAGGQQGPPEAEDVASNDAIGDLPALGREPGGGAAGGARLPSHPAAAISRGHRQEIGRAHV